MFEDRARHAATAAHETALACLDAGIEAAQPSTVVRETLELRAGEDVLTVEGTDYDLADVANVFVVGGGNAAGAIASALEDVVLASVDTDGRDGSTDAAGAIVDADTLTDRDRARRALDENDAYTLLEECGALLETGPTGTNVNDLRVLVVE